MKCFFFGHIFGKVEGGYQYCQRCGLATTPPLCKHGHTWIEYSKLRLEQDSSAFHSGWLDYKIASQCQICGERKSEWLYGH